MVHNHFFVKFDDCLRAPFYERNMHSSVIKHKVNTHYMMGIVQLTLKPSKIFDGIGVGRRGVVVVTQFHSFSEDQTVR